MECLHFCPLLLVQAVLEDSQSQGVRKPAGPARAGLQVLEQVLQSLLIILGHLTGREDILQSKKGYVREKNTLKFKFKV